MTGRTRDIATTITVAGLAVAIVCGTLALADLYGCSAAQQQAELKAGQYILTINEEVCQFAQDQGVVEPGWVKLECFVAGLERAQIVKIRAERWPAVMTVHRDATTD